MAGDARSAVDQTTIPLAGSSSAARAATHQRSGAIILARHGEPAISRHVRLSAAEYAAWWARYEETGLRDGQAVPAGLVTAAQGAAAILSSTRKRAIESARLVADGLGFETDPDLIEAPLPPPHWPGWIRLSPRIWGTVSRAWWWLFNFHDGQESRAQAEHRADLVADRLEAKAALGGAVLVVAHGWFNRMIGASLQRRGWKLTENQGYRYWSLRRFELN